MCPSLISVGAPIVDQLVYGPDENLKGFHAVKGGASAVASEQMLDIRRSISGLRQVSCAGGAAGNTASAFAHIGGRSMMLGIIGDDDAGRQFMQAMSQSGVDTGHLAAMPGMTGRCISYITPDAERTMFTFPGVGYDIKPDKINFSSFCEFSHCYLEGFLGYYPEMLMQLAHGFQASGIKICFGLGSVSLVEKNKEWLPDFLEKYVDMVFANGIEAMACSGEKSLESATASLSRHCPVAVVTDGANGAFAALCTQPVIHVAAPKVETVVDTTGAGDAFAAGFIYGMLSGASLTEAVRRGNDLASRIIQISGSHFVN